MKVFIAGATGVLGRRLVPRFAQEGAEVAGLARSHDGAELVRSLGGRRRWAPDFPSYREGIPQLVETWKREQNVRPVLSVR